MDKIEKGSIEREYCSYAHEGNCTKDFIMYEVEKERADILQQKLDKIMSELTIDGIQFSNVEQMKKYFITAYRGMIKKLS
jgi:hypothetical protein